MTRVARLVVHVQDSVLDEHIGAEPTPHDLPVDAPAQRQPPQGLARAKQEREGEAVGGHPCGPHRGVGREGVRRGAVPASAAAPGEALYERVVRHGGGAGAGSAEDRRRSGGGLARGRRGDGEGRGDEGREEARARGEAGGEELGVRLLQVARGLEAAQEPQQLLLHRRGGGGRSQGFLIAAAFRKGHSDLPVFGLFASPFFFFYFFLKKRLKKKVKK